jgi:hypothetical protein
VIGLVLLGAALLVAIAVVRFREPTQAEMLAELERALARIGRPLSADTTLAALEHRFRDSPEAQQYVRALRLARFAGGGAVPSPQQRRAVRRQLQSGLGPRGLARALWALPPRVRLRRALREASSQG